MRAQGYGLREIGEAQDQPITRQAVYRTVERALRNMVRGPLDEIRQLELLRLDEMLTGVYGSAISEQASPGAAILKREIQALARMARETIAAIE